MILVDVNVLVNAYNRDFPDHEVARRWWEELVNSREQIGLAWATIIGFIRIMTNPKAMVNPMLVSDALAAAESWLEQENVSVVDPGPRHREILFRLIRTVGVAGSLTSDAHLAALALEHQGQLASADTDFARFPGLKWINPLKPRSNLSR